MRKSTFYSFIAIILAAVIVIACGIGSSWFTNGDIKTWFNFWGQGNKTPDTESKSESYDGVVISSENDGEISLFSAPLMAMSADGVERAVPDSCVITASCNDNSLQSFVWEYAFENGASEWVNGKNINDYLSFNVLDDTRKITVSAKQAFGEPVVIMVKSAFALDITSTCKVDYIKRVSSATFIVNKGGSGLFELGNANKFEIIPTYSVGTVSGDFTVGEITASFSSKLDDYIRFALGSSYGYCQIQSFSFNADTIVTPFNFLYTPYGGGQSEIQAMSWGKLAYNTMLDRANISYAQSNDCYLIMSVDYTYTFNGSEVQAGTAEKNTLYSAGSLTAYNLVTNVGLDKDHIYL